MCTHWLVRAGGSMINCIKCKKQTKRIKELTAGLRWILDTKIPALEKENIETWDERNKACTDYDAIYRLLQLSRFTDLPKFVNYEMPHNKLVSDFCVDIEGRLLESGRIQRIVNLLEIPAEPVEWHTKYRKGCFTLKDIRKKKPTKKRRKKDEL